MDSVSLHHTTLVKVIEESCRLYLYSMVNGVLVTPFEPTLTDDSSQSSCRAIRADTVGQPVATECVCFDIPFAWEEAVHLLQDFNNLRIPNSAIRACETLLNNSGHRDTTLSAQIAMCLVNILVEQPFLERHIMVDWHHSADHSNARKLILSKIATLLGEYVRNKSHGAV